MTLKDFFETHSRTALAFSGGTDSAYLMYAGLRYGADIKAFYVHSPFQPQFELDDVLRLAGMLGADIQVIELNILENENAAQNGPRRCYFCKKAIMGSIISAASAQGYEFLIDGTNASDEAGDRPGMQALKELRVLSPLSLCGLTKPEIRALSREAGLFTWNKPAYACLATRVSCGEHIDVEKLRKIELGENFLSEMGFSDFRLRLRGENALLQFTGRDMEKAVSQLPLIRQELGKYFVRLDIDPAARKESL